MILVTGATGNCGRGAIDELRAVNAPVRALTRDREKAHALEGGGVEVAVADFARPDDLGAALEDVDTVFLVSSQHPEQGTLQGNVVEAAGKAGVKRIVKVSGGRGVSAPDSPSFVGRQHWQTEQQIAAGGFAYTFLRPNYYMQNLLTVTDPVRSGVLPIPLGDQRVGLIDARDVGRVAARVMTEDGRHDGEIYDLTGPEALTFSEVAERLSRATGTEVRHVDPPVDTAVENLRKKGAPDWLQQHFREIMGIFRDGAGKNTTDTVKHLTGRPPRSIDDFLQDYARAFS